MMRRVWPVLCVLTLCLSVGCRRESGGPAPTEPAAIARAESELGTLERRVNATELRTVDTVEVRFELVRNPGVLAGELNFEPEESGWSVVSVSPVETRLDAATGRLVSDQVFTLEPFLDGKYSIPAAQVALTSHDGGESTVLKTPALEVVVTSVLKEDDGNKLAPAQPLASESPVSDQRPYWFAAGLAGLILAVSAAIIVSRRLARTEPSQENQSHELDARSRAVMLQRDLSELLELIGDEPELQKNFAIDLEDRILRCHDLHDKDEWLDLAHRLDSAAYGPVEPTEATLAALDRSVRTLASRHVDHESTGGRE